jgi:hypothetical protein
MRVRSRIFALAMTAAFLAPAAILQTLTPQDLQAKFEQEPDVMRRARMLMDMSRADFLEIRDQVSKEKNAEALKTLQQLVDDMQQCSTALDAREPNPEGHPGGFKQMQIATRESLRRLDDLTVSMTADEQEPFLAIRKNLDQINRHLIHELFPHQALPPERADSEQDGDVRPQAGVTQ